MERDLADQGSNGRLGLLAGVRVGERVLQLENLAAVDLGDVRIDVGQLGRLDRDPRGDLRLLALERVEPRLHRWLVHAVLDGGDDRLDAAFDPGERLAVAHRLRALLAPLPVHLLMVGAHGLGDGVGRGERTGEPGKRAGLDVAAADRPAVVAGGAAVRVEAAIAVVDDDAVGAAAAAAFEETGEQIARPAQAAAGSRLGFAHAPRRRLEADGEGGLLSAHRLPEVILDDA